MIERPKKGSEMLQSPGAGSAAAQATRLLLFVVTKVTTFSNFFSQKQNKLK